MKNPKCYAINKLSEENNRGLKVLKAKTIYLQNQDPADLIAIGKFLIDCGTQLRRGNNKSLHLHFRDSKYCKPSKKRKILVDVIIDVSK